MIKSAMGSLAAIGEQSWRQRGVATPTSVYRQFAPAAAASLLVLYFWATVHKFNTGYFDKNLSCATMQLFNLHTKSVFGMKLAFVPTGDAARYFAIYGTLIVETAIPVLLALRPTRLVGVALAMGFHFVLGFSYPAFSSLIYALLPLFLPTSFWRALIAWWDRCWLHRVVRDVTTWKQVRWGLQLLFVLLVCFALPFRFEGLVPAESKLQMRYTCWLLYGTIMLWLFVRQLPQSSTERSSFPHVLLPPRSVLGVVLPALLFLNGIAPHIGLKSTQSFAMYSNLRAEGGTSNHLFIPAGWQIFDAQRDLVTILHSSDPLLRDLSRANWHGHRSNMRFGTYILRADVVRDDGRQAPRWQFPYVSLRQRIDDLARAGSTGIWLTFTRDGVEHHVVNAETDPELGQLSFWERKFYRMRAVPDIEEGCCMW